MKPFELSCHVISEDFTNVYNVVNQGIDARLTGFTQSNFELNGRRLQCEIHPLEMEILIRRLVGLNNDEAGYLADDIVSMYYGVEIV